MKVIIAGSRDCTDYRLVVDAVARSGFDVSEVVSGACRGVDAMGERWAQERGVPVKQFPADWKLHGKSAGPRRNQVMALYADALVAIWDGKSRGTKNMIDCAKQCGLPVSVYRTDEAARKSTLPDGFKLLDTVFKGPSY